MTRLERGLPGHPALQVFGGQAGLPGKKFQGGGGMQVLAEVFAAGKGRKLVKVGARPAQVFHPGVRLIRLVNNHEFLLVNADVSYLDTKFFFVGGKKIFFYQIVTLVYRKLTACCASLPGVTWGAQRPFFQRKVRSRPAMTSRT